MLIWYISLTILILIISYLIGVFIAMVLLIPHAQYYNSTEIKIWSLGSWYTIIKVIQINI